MAIATAGIVDQDWANTLSEMITSDNYVDYYLEMGNYGWNFPVDADDEETIRIQTNYIDSATGLQFRRTQDVNNADIYFVQTDYQFLNTPIDDGTLGFISVESDDNGTYFEVLYADNEAEVDNDNITIWHELGHALGLGHPYGDGFNPNYTQDDTIMSYNPPPSGIAKFTDSDIAALKFLWGEAGTNYDTSSTTPGTRSSIDNIVKGTNKKDKLKGTNGNDKIIGKGGVDKILGKGGDDIIDAGEWKKGDSFDRVKGGSGADIFVIGHDYWTCIKDFNIAEDSLDLSGLNVVGDLNWKIKEDWTYIRDDLGYEVAVITGAFDLSQANII
ncbi:zinc-dependent metalloprotease family protein [Synechococcus sp. MU1651]|uniref:zinc-dependent metalloprotease family protein n=1 Tax=Synechococcus sp. MU1651 TaxID=2508353 RepID=UPI002025D01D|nr:zinc-dependent metalloprotease family protein [Synechococcus sp. MU1651]